MNEVLTNDSITFGKYKGKKLKLILKDRSYCKWLLKQNWFKEQYPYLYNSVNDYEPEKYFISNNIDMNKQFIEKYPYFNLNPCDAIKIHLTPNEKKCYDYYLKTVDIIKNKIITRVENKEENIFNIKAPTKWLIKFENEYGLKRESFKLFIKSHDLKNITKIIEDIKSEGNIEYKGDKAYLIAKENSIKQENFWGEILKNNFGKSISSQLKYKKCIFDFIDINTNTIYECKLGLKDFNTRQYSKYVNTLNAYRIIYLFDYDCIVDMKNEYIYTINKEKYVSHFNNIKPEKTPPFQNIIKHFNIVNIYDINTGIVLLQI